MRSIRLTFIILLLAVSAAAQDVRYNFAGDVDFSKFKSFKWVQIKGADQLDQISEAQLKTAVDEELAKKGLSRTEAETADLFVGYQVSLERKNRSRPTIAAGIMAPGGAVGMVTAVEDSARQQLRRL